MRVRRLLGTGLLASFIMMGLGSSAKAAYVVRDFCPVGGTIEFYWTMNGAMLPPPVTVSTPGWHTFANPPLGANDWHQTVTDANGKSTVFAGSFNYTGMEWEYNPGFDPLPLPPWRIPDPIPIIPGPPENELFAAVNLEVYLTNNPWPAIDIGDVVSINNGEIPGLIGVQFSTTEPIFDAGAPLGWGNLTPFSGDANVVSVHSSVPEPAGLMLAGLGCLGLVVFRLRKRRVKS